MVLGMRRMSQLDFNRVVHCDEDEKQRVSHEVLLTIVAQRLVILTRFLVDLDRCRVDRRLSYKGDPEPDSHPGPETENLNEEA